jgi:hypothetical protein
MSKGREINDNGVTFMKEAGIYSGFLKMNRMLLVERECTDIKEICLGMSKYMVVNITKGSP